MGQRLAGVQALRGVACLMVVLFHVADLESTFGLGFNPLRPVRRVGYAGVDLFFVLSGFVIAVSARRGAAEMPGFLARRAWRIFPPFWAAFALAVGHHWLSGVPVTGAGGVNDLVEQLFLIPPSDGPPRLVPVSWSLSYEVMFYLAFGLLLCLPRRAAAVVLLGWGVAVVAVSTAGVPPTNRLARLVVHPHVLEFLAGVLVSGLPGRLSSIGARGVVVAAIAWAAGGVWLTYHPDPLRLPADVLARAIVFGPAAALLLWAVVARERGGGVAPPRWLLAVGDASYSIYLVHMIAILGVMLLSHRIGWGHSRVPHVLWIVACVAAGVGAGLLFHRWIERPLLTWGKRRKFVLRLPRFRSARATVRP